MAFRVNLAVHRSASYPLPMWTGSAFENQGWVETSNEPTIYDDVEKPEPSDDEYFDYSEPKRAQLPPRRTFLRCCRFLMSTTALCC